MEPQFRLVAESGLRTTRNGVSRYPANSDDVARGRIRVSKPTPLRSSTSSPNLCSLEELPTATMFEIFHPLSIVGVLATKAKSIGVWKLKLELDGEWGRTT